MFTLYSKVMGMCSHFFPISLSSLSLYLYVCICLPWQALAEVKGATYAKDLFFKVKDSRAQEAAVSKKATLRTQKRMATIRSDRGLKFERFVAGPHGARDVDLEGVEKHAKAMALKGVVDESDSDEDEEGDSDEEEGEEEGGEEGGGGVGGGGGES
mmetsp:Transcript_19839/g.25887  ORF Transcript_19839/g.25887 Transcript_19839/m.25887 type:complete len:156 (+) Transcript_19839:970-1437(+)